MEAFLGKKWVFAFYFLLNGFDDIFKFLDIVIFIFQPCLILFFEF